MIRNWKTEILTIPNLLSLLRLGLIPVYLTVYLQATRLWQYRAAGVIMALSCLTDAIDGKIARQFHMGSTLGKILDPLADKLTQFALTVCLSLKYPVLQPVLALFAAKEIVQMILGIVYLRRGQILPGALMAGKVCTTVLFVSLIALVLFPAAPSRVVGIIAVVDSLFLMIAFAGYLEAYLGPNARLHDLKEE